MKENNTFKKLSAIVSLAVLGVLTALIVWPIAAALITGLLLAYIFFPVYKKILKKTKRRTLSAFILMFCILILLFIPFRYILPLIVRETFNIYLYLQDINFLEIFNQLLPNVRSDLLREFAIALNRQTTEFAGRIFSGVSNIVLNLPSFFLKVAVTFFVFFFAMRDYDKLSEYIKTLSPFSHKTEEEVAQKFRDVTSTVIYGFFAVGMMQGLLTGLGLFIFGLPNPVILTLVAIVVAIIPIIGAWLVWFPASIYLVLSGNILLGIGLALYGLIVVTWIDQLLRPYIVARKIKISTAIVLIGMIGGFLTFGILGFILGPLIISYLVLLLDAYRKGKLPSLFEK